MLQFGMKLPFSFTKFLQMCEKLVVPSDLEALKLLPGNTAHIGATSGIPLVDGYREFEATLLNELVKVRSARRHKDPQKYIRPDADIEPEMVHLANSAVRNPSVLDAEKELDRARWGILDGLERGHFFDREALLVYGYKLLILERWEAVRTADREKLMQAALLPANG